MGIISMDKKTITIGALSAVVVSLLIMGADIDISGGNVYFCEERMIVMECDSLSQYYELDNGKCNNAELGNKVCSTGWLLIIDEVPVNETNETVNETKADTMYLDAVKEIEEGISIRQSDIIFLTEQKEWVEKTDEYYDECVQKCYKDCEIMTEMEIAALESTIDSLETEIAELESELAELKK